MKQTSFIVEVVASDGAPTIIVRAQNGVIVKITSNPEEVSSFLQQVLSNLSTPQAPAASNP